MLSPLPSEAAALFATASIKDASDAESTSRTANALATACKASKVTLLFDPERPKTTVCALNGK